MAERRQVRMPATKHAHLRKKLRKAASHQGRRGKRR
jgi:hypothetical protein